MRLQGRGKMRQLNLPIFLSLQSTSQSFEYCSILFSLSRVTVHSRDTLPVDDQVLDVQPNTATNIAINRVRIHLPYLKFRIFILNKKQVKLMRKPAPHGNCISGWSETGMNEEALKFGARGTLVPYTQGVDIKKD